MFEQRPMRVGDWFLYHLLMVIPLVNIIMYFVLLLSTQTNRSLKSLMIFQLIIILIFVGLIISGIAGVRSLLPPM